MKQGLWAVFCNNSECSTEVGKKCSSEFLAFINPDSCTKHLLVISVDILLFFTFLYIFVHKLSSRKLAATTLSQRFSPMLISSSIFNGILGLAYLALGIQRIFQKLNTDQTLFPMHGWLVMLFQGFTWWLLDLTASLLKLHHPRIKTMRLCSILAVLFAGILSISTLWEAIAENVVSIKMIMDLMSFPGAILLLLCAIQKHSYMETDPGISNDAYYALSQGEDADATGKVNSDKNVTSFAKAGFLSTMTFSWLNPLMKIGKEKTLEDEEIPQLRKADQAHTCYLMLMEQMSQWKQKGSSDSPSIWSIIFFWQWKAIIISGFFALIKVLTLSAGPLLLKAFTQVIEGKAAFKYEGYALTAVLFLLKCLESLSERQWYFQTRLIGLQVKSSLSAAIYEKQLRLSIAAKMNHSLGEIVNYVTVDANRIGEFSYWFHQIWSTSLQLCLALAILYYSVGLATVAALVAIILTMLASFPFAKLQLKYQRKFMVAQERWLKAITEALANMKVLKLYAWEMHFKNVIQGLRNDESKLISAVLSQKGYCITFFWSSPTLASVFTFWACYFLRIPLYASIIQKPLRSIPDVAGAFIEAKVSLARIVKFLEAPELQKRQTRLKYSDELDQSIFIRSTEISWDAKFFKATLRNINLVVKPGEKVGICGEIGSGKSTLLAAILGEVPHINGTVHVYGKIAYVSQTAWIQAGTIKKNILFGSAMDPVRYQEVLEKCSLVKDLEMLPFGNLTQIGERGVNLSGGQKQRVQLARALYQDADVYLLDDPFSAVDAHTATSLFNEYVMGALSGKTVLLVTHQVDFLPAFNSILLMSAGEILRAANYDQLMASSQEFQELVNAHNKTAGSERHVKYASTIKHITSKGELENTYNEEQLRASLGDQLIKLEERETGDTGLKPYMQYLSQSKGFLYFSLITILHIIFLVGNLIQSYWLAAKI